MRAAIERLAELGGDAAANALADRLRKGLPPALIEPAIDALERIGKPQVAPVLLELALHKRPQVRKRAIQALGALRIRSAQAALLYALDDPSPEVRDAAVQALSRVGTARALPALFAAADRGLAQALTAIGRIATQRDVKTIMQHAKDGDITRIKPALQTMIEREDFPVGGKVTLVKTVAALGSDDARNHLVQWLDSFKAQGDPRVRNALFEAIKRLDGAASKAAAASAAKVPAPAKAAPAAAAAPPEVAAAVPVAKGGER